MQTTEAKVCDKVKEQKYGESWGRSKGLAEERVLEADKLTVVPGASSRGKVTEFVWAAPVLEIKDLKFA